MNLDVWILVSLHFSCETGEMILPKQHLSPNQKDLHLDLQIEHKSKAEHSYL